MITKLTALALSAIMTVGLVAAAAPTVVETAPKEVNITPMINSCRQAYAEYRSGKVDGTTSFNKAIAPYTGLEREIATLICTGYGIGYRDAERTTHA